jgi:acetyl-CoA C-acetyltransferase
MPSGRIARLRRILKGSVSSRVAILEAKRTPIGSSSVHFGITRQSSWAPISRAVLLSSKTAPDDVDEVIFGHARQAGNGPNPARQVGVRSGVPEATCAFTVNAACGSGLKAIALGADSIRLGRAEVVLAGGMENMSQVPFLLDRAREGYRLGHAPLVDDMYRDGFLCPLCEMVMGETAEVLAEEFKISRRTGPLGSHESEPRGARAGGGRVRGRDRPGDGARERGEPVTVARDEHPRPGVTATALAGWRPCSVEGRSPPATRPASTTARRRWSSRPKPRRRDRRARRSDGCGTS